LNGVKRRIWQFVVVFGFTLTLIVTLLAARAATSTDAFTVHWTSEDGIVLRKRSMTLITGSEQFVVRYRVVEAPAPITRARPGVATPTGGLKLERLSMPTAMVEHWRIPPTFDSRLARLGFPHTDRLTPMPGVYMWPGTTEQRWGLPVWFVITLFGMITLLAAWRVNADSRRRIRLSRLASGLCPGCGHELRGAAYKRCPECGAVVTVQSAPA
jgi:hypothetical protein